MPPWDQWDDILEALSPALVALGGLLTALGAVIGSLIGGRRNREEARSLRISNDALERELAQGGTVDEVLSELRPNHGGSALDKLNLRFDSLEAVLEVHGTAIARIEHAQDGLSSDIRGIRRDYGRLADEQVALRDMVDTEHRDLRLRIEAATRAATRQSNQE